MRGSLRSAYPLDILRSNLYFTHVLLAQAVLVASQEGGLTEKKRILLVEDEQSIALVLRGVLREQGYAVRVAFSAEEALETLKNWEPDLLMADIKLPGMDGFSLIQTMKDDPKHSNVQYVIVTAFNDRVAVDRAKNEFGIEYYITKPFELAVVENAVSEIMNKLST